MLEELASLPITHQQVIYQPGIAPPPPPSSGVVSPQPRHFAKRPTNLGELKTRLLIEAKEKLLAWGLVEPELEKRFKEEIEELKKQLSENQPKNEE